MFKKVLLSAGLFFLVCEAAGVPKGSPCPALKLKFGRVRYRQRGRFVKFMCNMGYIIAGEKYSTCHNGAWDSPMPKCVRASCLKVNPPVNGLIYPSHRGAVLNFFCKPGYDLRGANATYCDGYTWDNKLPSCIVSNSKPALSCDFESEDLCGWNHDLRHDFDWIRMNFRTPSGHLGTGPSFDHTKGEGNTGYYMYIESSSRNENDTARLISPIYDKMNDSNVCLEFFYHMHGASTGQLRVYLKKESDSWDLDPNKALFWKSGNHGDEWLRSLTQLGSIDEDFQIIIEGVRGTSYFSDIAIDDVKIISNCTIDEDVTTDSDVTYTDDFEKLGSCLNRCDNDNQINPPDSFQFNCGCDDLCLDNNTCCLDYIAICVLGPLDDYSTTEASTSVEYSTTDEITTTELTTKATIKPKVIKPINNITSNEINSVLPKNKTESIPKHPVQNTTNSTVVKPLSPTGKRPALVFLTPSTPEVIIRRIIQVTTPAHITTIFKEKPKPSVKPISIKATTQAPVEEIDEVLTVPRKTETDETPYFTFQTPINSNPAPVKKLNTVLSMQNEKIVKEQVETSNVSFIMVIVALIAAVLVVASVTVFFVKRYRRLGWRNRNAMYGTSSDSQSDVRFLTGEEILDFNIACPDPDD